MTPSIRIDFVSDISCPWCAIGLSALEIAIARMDGAAEVEIHFQPFELNPSMPPGGQDIAEHLTQKYGSTPAQQAQVRETIRQRGAAVGFEFRQSGRDRIYNTFNAHRLLHWAGLPETQPAGRQHALKKALLEACFTRGLSPEAAETLLEAVSVAGLDRERAAAILATDDYTSDVRAAQRSFTDAGIQAVPAVILNQRYLISGGQPAEVFEDALRQLVQRAGERVEANN